MAVKYVRLAEVEPADLVEAEPDPA
jgi:hypothetical protein